MQRGYTQRDVCELANIDRVYYLDIENNIHFPSVDYCNRIALALDAEPSYLYDDYMNFITSDYSETIRKKRLDLRLNQHALGKLLGVHSSTIKKWENNHSIINRESHAKLKDLL